MVFPYRGRQVGEIALRWQRGRSVRSYLTDPLLREYHLMGTWKHCRVTNQRSERLRTSSLPKPGDSIILRRA